jgi:two-component system OmpR family sensor kinase
LDCRGLWWTVADEASLEPLVTLTERAEQIGTSKLGERLLVVPTGDKMERLSLSLNRIISRLEDALSYNRRFSADVSHELRTH